MNGNKGTRGGDDIKAIVMVGHKVQCRVYTYTLYIIPRTREGKERDSRAEV